jgi:nucleoside-diphosphate-sugar epimerase
MQVLVTGCSGFIGNHVVKELLKREIKVIATSKSEVKVKKFSWYQQVTYIPTDLNTRFSDVFEYFNEPSHLIHLAWEGLPNYNQFYHIDKNLFRDYFFIKEFVQQGLKNITITGTCLEYGMVNGILSENMIPEPHNPYALAKDSLRRLLQLLQKETPFALKWMRLFYMYGEGQNEKSLLSQLYKALDQGDEVFNMSGGEQLRDYLPVEKVAQYIVDAALQTEIQGAINCCSGKPLSVRKLVEDKIKESGKSIKLNLGYYPYPDYEPLAFWGDVTKLNLIVKNNAAR